MSIFSEPRCAKFALMAAEESHIAGEGYAFILSSRSSLFENSVEFSNSSILKTGSLMILEEGTEDSTWSKEY